MDSFSELMTQENQAAKPPVTGFTISKRWVFWIAIIIAFFIFLHAIKAILLPFVVGIFLAYFLDPAVGKLEKWGCSRISATAVIILGFFFVFALAMALLLPQLFDQLGNLITELPALINDVKHYVKDQTSELTGKFKAADIASAKEAVTSLSAEVAATASVVVATAFKSSFALINLLSLIVITPVVSFYLLRDWDVLVGRVDALLPRRHAPIIREQIKKIDQAISGFLRGTVNVMAILCAYYTISLSLAGLNFSIIIGLAAGMLIIIPYLGTVISGSAAIGMAFLQYDSVEPVMIIGGIFVAGQMLEGYFLTPKLIGNRVGLHPLWVIFGMLAGATLFGFVGVFLAVPVTAIIGVLVRFATERYIQSDYYQEKNGEPPLVV